MSSDTNPKLDVVIMACEKAVGMVKDMEARLKVLEESNRKLVQENQNLKTEIGALRAEVGMLASETGIANFHANAEEDAYHWMMEAKDEDATELPLSRKEIAERMEKIHQARVDRNGSRPPAMHPRVLDNNSRPSQMAFTEDY
jgi:predicted RNase H-like nuclease (RuvC/YqgF family)